MNGVQIIPKLSRNYIYIYVCICIYVFGGQTLFILFNYFIGWEARQAAGISIKYFPDVEPEVAPETKT